jgi:hypothetical protein
VALLLLAVALRTQRLQDDRYLPLDSDASDYLQAAGRMGLSGVLDTGYREPGFVWLVKAATWLGGTDGLTIRRVSLVASVSLVALTYVLGATLFGPAGGLVAAGLLAVNHELVFQSARGLKEEVFAVLLLALLVTLFGRPGRQPARRWLLAALLGGVLGLVRLTGLLSAGALLVDRALVAFWSGEERGRRSIVLAAAGVCVLVAVVSPYLGWNARRVGDPFYSLSVAATFYRNMEYGGSQERAAKQENAAGTLRRPQVTALEYVFGLHTPREILRRYVEGVRWLFGFWLAALGALVTLGGLAGLLGLAVTRSHFAPLALGTAVFPFLFGFTVAPDMSRFTVPTFPLLAVGFAGVVIAVMTWARRLEVQRGARGAPWIAAALMATVLATYGYGELVPKDYVYNEDFNDGGRRMSHEAQPAGGWSFAVDGLSLVPGQSGEVVYRFERRGFRRATLRVWFYAGPAVENWLEVSGDGRTFATVSHNRHHDGDTLDLTGFVAGRERFYLRFRASYDTSERVGDRGDEQLVLDKFTLWLSN